MAMGVYNDVVQHTPIRILNDLIIIEHPKGEVVAFAFDNGYFRKLAPTQYSIVPLHKPWL